MNGHVVRMSKFLSNYIICYHVVILSDGFDQKLYLVTILTDSLSWYGGHTCTTEKIGTISFKYVTG